MPQAKKWRLSKTLARNVTFNPVEMEDLAYAWAAYKTEGLPHFPEGLTQEQFKTMFSKLVLDDVFHAIWALKADTKRGHIPVGFAFGFWLHPAQPETMIVNQLVWLPWATARNKLETTANFVTKGRKEMKMMAFSRVEDKSFLEVLAKHGIIRRVGTSHNVFSDGPATVWETRHG